MRVVVTVVNRRKMGSQRIIAMLVRRTERNGAKVERRSQEVKEIRPYNQLAVT
jgi:phytoene dehydrogenase-like protein